MDLILDYRANVARYPDFQAYFRKHRPPLLAVCVDVMTLPLCLQVRLPINVICRMRRFICWIQDICAGDTCERGGRSGRSLPRKQGWFTYTECLSSIPTYIRSGARKLRCEAPSLPRAALTRQ